jgi:hypothetical protein
MKWLERARREIQESTPTATANSAERNPTALMAGPDPAICINCQASAPSPEIQSCQGTHRESSAHLLSQKKPKNPAVTNEHIDEISGCRFCGVSDLPDDQLGQFLDDNGGDVWLHQRCWLPWRDRHGPLCPWCSAGHDGEEHLTPYLGGLGGDQWIHRHCRQGFVDDWLATSDSRETQNKEAAE